MVSSRSRADAVVTILDGNLPRDKKLSISHENNRLEIRRHDFFSRSVPGLSRTSLSVEPEKYAFDSWFRVFITCLGIRNNAVLVHGAGYFRDGRTFLFPGRSGRGKSTMIRILGKEYALSDELTLLYLNDGKPWCASTPFWGELSRGTGRTSKGPLGGIYFLKHGRSEIRAPLGTGKTVRELLKTVLFFDRDPRRAGELLGFVSSVAVRVPAFRLTFAKDSSRKRILDILENP